MSSTETTPTLLPGVPASTWSRAAAIAVPFTIPVYLGLAYFRLTQGDNDAVFHAWFVPLMVYGGVIFLTVFVLGFLMALRNKQEGAAGYTTQWRSQPTVPQLDARTGALVRAAGQPYVKRSDWRERTFAGGSTPTAAADVSPWGQPKPGPWSGIVGVLPNLAVVVAVVAGAVGYTASRGGNVVESVIVTVVALIVVLALIFAIGASVVRGRIQRLERAAPGDFVFVFAKSKGYSDAFAAQAIRTGPASGAVQRGVSANTDGLTVWEGNPFERVLHFGWDVITSIQVDTVSGSNRSGNLVLVTFKSHVGALSTLPLAYAKFSSFPVPSKAGVTWIVAQLNALREHKTAPRVI